MALDIPVEHYQTDVLVVGGGAAGAMACFECADAGVKVILAGKSRPPSGTTSVARGGFAAAMGPGDSPELHLAEILEHGGELIDPELAGVWCEGIIDVVKDLQSWGRREDSDRERKYADCRGWWPANRQHRVGRCYGCHSSRSRDVENRQR